MSKKECKEVLGEKNSERQSKYESLTEKEIEDILSKHTYLTKEKLAEHLEFWELEDLPF